jgi:hypothetical protein
LIRRVIRWLILVHVTLYSLDEGSRSVSPQNPYLRFETNNGDYLVLPVVQEPLVGTNAQAAPRTKGSTIQLFLFLDGMTLAEGKLPRGNIRPLEGALRTLWIDGASVIQVTYPC